MNINAQNECADVPRACRGYIRAIRLTLPIFISLSLALAPFSANLTNSGICVEKSEAYANPVAFAGAYAFLEECAIASGFASVGDFIATGAGICAVGSGLTLGTAEGIKLGNSAHNNLEALIDAADYPAYNSLTPQEQEDWGNADNYNAAKYNSFMAAFGLGDDYERYQNTWGTFTPGEFQFSTSSSNTLEKIGDIGNNWVEGVYNTFEDVKDMFTPDYITRMNSFTGVKSYTYFDGTELEGYPSNAPKHIYVCKGDYLLLEYQRSFKYEMKSSNPDVYWIVVINGVDYGYCQFSKEVFNYGSAIANLNPAKPNATSTAYPINSDKGTYYKITGSGSGGSNNVFVSSNMQYNLGGNYSNSDYFDAVKWILFSDQIDRIGQLEPDIMDYPGLEVIPDDQEIYYPEDGIDEDTTWDDLTTEPEEPEEPVTRPSNVYNPDDLTGTQEWRDETESNVMPLTKIRFDKLFPFCLMTDVQEVTEKIQETITPGEQSNYLKIKIPMAYASDGDGGSVQEDIELDGTPVHDLLIMVRPFNQALLLFLMIFTLVMFWKSILTGD